ncbi:MAG: hypothetical protein JSS86_00865 [Cyanobacteria bacterium SZAS LIN-2]|nr:hypothetical protein [Cyanobacteria bacterium SZAS LIN-3]MBS1994821.1 hypothetical protein [Cyanobacteria bacterium SZAS LIN-2]
MKAFHTKHKIIAAVSISALLVCIFLSIRLAKDQAPPPPPLFKPDSRFAIGVNYPWRNYGGDFGATVWGSHDGVSTPAAGAEIDRDFAHLADLGLNVVRWFVFCDGRGGLTFSSDGQVTGIDSHVIADMGAALQLAHKHNIRLIFVLLDFNFAQRTVWASGVMVGGHRKVIENPYYSSGFQSNALAPLLQAFGTSSDIAAWEIINEPEWIMTAYPFWQIKKLDEKKVQAFVHSTALFIKARAKQPVTVGSASREGLKYWGGCDLDFLQFHSYPYLERKNPLDTPAVDLNYNIPIVLGEFPTDKTRLDTGQYFQLMYQNGYVGALAWSYRARDKYTNLTQQEQAIKAWRKGHAAAHP